MTLVAGLLKAYVSAFAAGVGIGVVSVAVVRLVKGVFSSGD